MDYLTETMEAFGMNTELSWLISLVTSLALLLLVCAIVFKVMDLLVRKGVSTWVKHTKNEWDDLILEKRIIPRAAQLAPVLAISVLTPILFEGQTVLVGLIDKLAAIYLIVVIILILDACINFAHAVYHRRFISQGLPLTGFVQALKLILFLVGGILIIAQILGESPLVLVSGLGAMTAILLLVFREPILGLVAGIQLTANNMVKKGDWIQMDKHSADGTVNEITLTTVIVQNWDKTIVSIPAYDLIQNAFINWRGIYEAGGRRIKRNLYVDLNSVTFLDEEVLDRFSGYRFLEDYLKEKRKEVQSFNENLGPSKNVRVDGRNLTNIGTFRAYCVAYLRNHPLLNLELTMMVRQMEPTAQGLPIQVYCFTKDTDWIPHENVQSDLFDHFLAVLPEFNLRAFQTPSGLDVKSLTLGPSSDQGSPDPE